MAASGIPPGLGLRGRRCWRELLEKYDLNAAELELAAELCRTLDELDRLRVAVLRDGEVLVRANGAPRAHPALAELRGARLMLSRLVSQLALPDPLGRAAPSIKSQRAQRAAQVRWLHVKRMADGPA
jgi:phage terminase small subunit